MKKTTFGVLAIALLLGVASTASATDFTPEQKQRAQINQMASVLNSLQTLVNSVTHKNSNPAPTATDSSTAPRPVDPVLANKEAAEKLAAQMSALQEQLSTLQGNTTGSSQGGVSTTVQPIVSSPNSNVSGCVQLNNNMGRGSADATTNGEVTKLQIFLQSKGYLNATPTGTFGPLTVAAVKSLQAANGIDSTGTVASATRALIANLTCK